MQNTAGPTIFKSPDISQATSQITKNPKGWFRRNILLVVIAVVVLGILGFGALSYFAPETIRNLGVIQPQIHEMSYAELSLIPEKRSYKKGEAVMIRVKLFTGGHSTDSTDLVVKYDPQFLQPEAENFVSVGQIYSEYPTAQVDEKQGLIGVSGITIPGSQGFSGIGEFARLNFVALKDGQTEVSLDYKEGSTADTNVVLSGSATDILGLVDNATINISNSEAVSGEERAQSCGSFTQFCEDSSGAAGTQVCNAGTIKDGVCGYDSRLTTSCEACKI